MDDPWSSAGDCGVGERGAAARVLVLRPKGQASALRERLEARGACVLSVPVLEICAPESYAALDAGLLEVGAFDWVVLTSANAVDVVAARWPRGARWQRLAVVGAATLARVREVGLPEPAEVLVPARAVAESLAEEMEPLVRELVRERGGARVFLPRAEAARDVLPERLRAAGAEVVVATAYRNGVPAESVEVLRGIFARRELWPDAIPFTSSSSVTHLLAVLEAGGLRLPEEVLRVSIGPVTSETLRECGLPPHAEAREATVESLADAVMEALAGRG